MNIPLMIAASVAALLLGLFLGRPGRYNQSLEELDDAMGKGKKSRKQTRRHFMFLDMLHKERRGSRKRRHRRAFQSQEEDPKGPRSGL